MISHLFPLADTLPERIPDVLIDVLEHGGPSIKMGLQINRTYNIPVKEIIPQAQAKMPIHKEAMAHLFFCCL